MYSRKQALTTLELKNMVSDDLQAAGIFADKAFHFREEVSTEKATLKKLKRGKKSKKSKESSKNKEAAVEGEGEGEAAAEGGGDGGEEQQAEP